MARKDLKEYHVWKAMKARCYSSCHKNSNYQKNNLEVCDKWRNDFNAFFKDMGKRPGENYSIDRIDNSKGYYPENCRWATQSEQCKNRGSFNKVYIYNGEAKVLKDWAKHFGIKYTTLYLRITREKLSFEEAISRKNRYENFYYDNKYSSLKDIVAEHSIVPYMTITSRLSNGWDLEKALKTPKLVNQFR